MRPWPASNPPIPTEITTPDRVATRLGGLEFADGVPTHETTERLFDHLDFLRGVEAFLNCIPAASWEGMRRGMLLASTGITKDAPVAPDERMRTILTDAAAVGNATARAIAFRSREADCRVYEDRREQQPVLPSPC